MILQDNVESKVDGSHVVQIAGVQYEGSQLALFTLGAAIILLGTIAIAFICISWLR